MSNIAKLIVQKSQFEQFGSNMVSDVQSEIVQCLKSQLESFTIAILVNFDNTNHLSTTIPVKITLWKSRPYGSRAVITGIPLEVTDGELMEALSDYRLTFVKRLRKKTENGFRPSLSYLLCFQSKEAPKVVTFGYLHLLTRPYNPPPQRCYKCNRFGHKHEQCRGKRCCSKCWSKEHDYKECPNDKTASTAEVNTVLHTVGVQYISKKQKSSQ